MNHFRPKKKGKIFWKGFVVVVALLVLKQTAKQICNWEKLKKSWENGENARAPRGLAGNHSHGQGPLQLK